MRRKDEERARARELRRAGRSVRVIADELGVAVSSVSTWTRDCGPRRAPARRDWVTLPVWRSGRAKGCGHCRRTLPHECFPTSGGRPASWCRRCYREDARRRAQQRAVVRAARKAALRARVLQRLADAVCADCGIGETVLLEFDHVDGKEAEIARLCGGAASVARLEAELDRCEVVCVNCHRWRTARRGRQRRAAPRWWETDPPAGRSRARNLAIVLSHLERASCVDCGEAALPVLDFDHVDGKTREVTTLAHDGCSEARLRAEIARCEVRCANCHRRRTAREQGSYRVLGDPQ